MTDLPEGVERDHPLATETTVRVGGPADFFAKPETAERVAELLSWARSSELPTSVIGSGSNTLVADAGFRGLVIELAGHLARIDRDGTSVVCGGGARLPSIAGKLPGWGLTGLEFGANIPGTAGGAVRMNANAYGGALADVLEWVEITTAAGSERREPGQLGFVYRGSNLGPDEVVTEASFRMRAADADEVRARLAEMREWRHSAQPKGVKTFGSTFVNPDDPGAEGKTAGQLLDAVGARGLQVGGARLNDKHANFVENVGNATAADVLAVMAEGRRRVFDRFGVVLRPEVQILGDVEWPEGWELPK
jgi:UDP-N-acetylmuramate dehydrogenase